MGKTRFFPIPVPVCGKSACKTRIIQAKTPPLRTFAHFLTIKRRGGFDGEEAVKRKEKKTTVSGKPFKVKGLSFRRKVFLSSKEKGKKGFSGKGFSGKGFSGKGFSG